MAEEEERRGSSTVSMEETPSLPAAPSPTAPQFHIICETAS